LDADSIKMLSKYDQAIFENGSPFIGDKMDPIIASTQTTTVVISVDSHNRNQIFSINETEKPFVDNMLFYDWNEEQFPIQLPTQQTLFKEGVTFTKSTNGL